MDSNFRIYSAEEALIPAEDKARLEGFLKGREEAEMKDKLADLEAQVRSLEEERRGE